MTRTITLTDNPAVALALWEANEAATILTNGDLYALGPHEVLEHALGTSWRQTCPEELEALLAQGQ